MRTSNTISLDALFDPGRCSSWSASNFRYRLELSDGRVITESTPAGSRNRIQVRRGRVEIQLYGLDGINVNQLKIVKLTVYMNLNSNCGGPTGPAEVTWNATADLDGSTSTGNWRPATA